MGCNRENKNIWWYLFSFERYGKKRWRGYDLLKKRFWFGGYVFHDSIGKYFDRLVMCKLRGHYLEHKHIHNIADPGEEDEWHCFACGQRITKPESSERVNGG